MRTVGVVLGVCLAMVSAGCAVPQPGGVGQITRHYEIRTDVKDDHVARIAGATADHVHRLLETHFGQSLPESFPLVVFTNRVAFDGTLSPSLRGRGFVGECGSTCALVYWPDDLRGADTLAHELVHHFVNEAVPGLPYWVDEGLAKALAPKRTATPDDWLAVVNELREGELARALDSLDALPEGPDYALRCLVAAAVVRHGLETAGLRDLRDLEGWQPDRAKFVAWLRARRWMPFHRFAPVLDPID